jgi:hypothetical protein
MRFVGLKSEDQLDMQTLHRSRDRLVGERTALINQVRAILLERGIVVPQGKRKLEQYLVVLMEEEEGRGLSVRMWMLIADMRAQWLDLDRRIAAFEAEFTSFASCVRQVLQIGRGLGQAMFLSSVESHFSVPAMLSKRAAHRGGQDWPKATAKGGAKRP